MSPTDAPPGLQAHPRRRGPALARPDAPDRPDARSDAELLQAIAARDREAFRALYERHRNAVYNLALRLAGPHRAEDAFQEAFLRVWRSAGNFRSDGNARGWMLRIAARESMKRLERSRKHERMASLDAQEAPEQQDARSRLKEQDMETSAERTELLEGLNRGLDALPASARRLVLLHFAGGLSHAEIAKELAMSASTVTYQLDKAVKALRSNLTQAGFAAAAPLLSAEGLADALGAGKTAPASLQAAVEAKLGEAALAAAEGSVRAAALGSGKVGVVAAVTIVALAGTGAWVYYADRKPDAPAATARAPEAARPPAPKGGGSAIAPGMGHQVIESDLGPGVADPYVKARWDFTLGPANNLDPVEGAWEWKPAEGDIPPGMRTKGPPRVDADGPQTVLLLPIEFPAKPVVVTIKSAMVDYKTTHHAGAAWTPKGALLNSEVWSKFTHQAGRAYSCTTYLYDRYATTVISSGVGCVRRYEKPYPAGHIIIGLRNLVVQKIEVRTLKPGDVPAELRDGEALIQQILDDPERQWPLPGDAPGDEKRTFKTK